MVQEPIQSISVKIFGAFSPAADGAGQVVLPDGVTVAYVRPRPDAAVAWIWLDPWSGCSALDRRGG